METTETSSSAQNVQNAPNDAELRGLLSTVRRVAVIGAKDVSGQPVDRVGRYLIDAGYTVIPVHPKRKTVWGLPAFASVASVPGADLVVVFRAPQYCAGHAIEVLAMTTKPRCFWMQEGITSPVARELLEAAGLMVVEDRCIAVEHSRLCAGK